MAGQISHSNPFSVLWDMRCCKSCTEGSLGVSAAEQVTFYLFPLKHIAVCNGIADFLIRAAKYVAFAHTKRSCSFLLALALPSPGCHLDVDVHCLFKATVPGVFPTCPLMSQEAIFLLPMFPSHFPTSSQSDRFLAPCSNLPKPNIF